MSPVIDESANFVFDGSPWSRRGYQPMERVWCWRCKAWVHALDQSEYRCIYALFRDNIVLVKEARSQGQTLDEARSQYAPMIAAYEKLTGDVGVSAEEILKHRIGDFGPPCEGCGKNLRTPRAAKCFECGMAAILLSVFSDDPMEVYGACNQLRPGGLTPEVHARLLDLLNNAEDADCGNHVCAAALPRLPGWTDRAAGCGALERASATISRATTMTLRGHSLQPCGASRLFKTTSNGAGRRSGTASPQPVAEPGLPSIGFKDGNPTATSSKG